MFEVRFVVETFSSRFHNIEKRPNRGVIPSVARNPSCSLFAIEERFLVARRGGLLGMTTFAFFRRIR